jgi:RimJ/RimL family protein N-acetyltransferase
LTVRLVADGCVLRPWSDADVPALVEQCRDPEIVRWLPNIPQPYTDADARSFVAHALESSISGDRAEFAIVDEQDVLLGSAGMRLREIPPSLGYWVAGSARGRGIATAATRALTAWAFETLGATRIALYAEPGNLASQRVAAKCGFVRVPGAVKREADRELWVFELSAP